jgi:predicted DNA-binding transcriptional regulator YafY
MAAGDIMGGLRRALESQRPVWIGYADVSGTTSDRVVEPLRLDGGFLTAFDTRTEEVRTFTVARITGVAEIPHDSGRNP